MIHIDPVDRVRVNLKWLELDLTRELEFTSLPADCHVEQLTQLNPEYYLYLHDGVGRDLMWWMRNTLSYDTLHGIINQPWIRVYELTYKGQAVGMLELDCRSATKININYFGLFPQARGKGLGGAWLSHSLKICKELGAKSVTLNTCNADHPRALGNYLKGGFKVVRESVETWPIPRRLNLPIHEGLRI